MYKSRAKLVDKAVIKHDFDKPLEHYTKEKKPQFYELQMTIRAYDKIEGKESIAELLKQAVEHFMSGAKEGCFESRSTSFGNYSFILTSQDERRKQ